MQIIAGCAMLVEETRKITFNASLKVLNPHNIRGVMQQKADKWISDARLLKYEGILLETPNFTLETTSLQNPASFLFGEPESGPLTHDCVITIEEQTKIRPDLEEEELESGEKLFVDGSSRVIDGLRRSGYAIIGGPDLTVVESGALDETWSAQACELYAILRALELLKGKEGTIFTDSKYGYGVVHTFGKLWEERGLTNSQWRDLIHQKLIKDLLKALRNPAKIAIVHIRGHQKGLDYRSRGNNAADNEAKKAALLKTLILRENRGDVANTHQEQMVFTQEEKEKLIRLGVNEVAGKWQLNDGREVLPKAVARRILNKIHQKTHWGAQGLADHFGTRYMTIGLIDLAKNVTKGCPTCLRVNRKVLRKPPLGGRPVAKMPFAHLQIDFTELPKVGRVKYLLVIIDHLTHYVDAFPTTRETARTVTKFLLEEIVPRYGVPEVIDSDKGPHFTSKVTQSVAEVLGIKWEQHTPWHPQSSGRVERMNGEIKKQLTKLVLETKLSWVKCLPLALLNIRTQPRADVGLSPFEMLYGMPYSLEKTQSNPNISDQSINKYLSVLMGYKKKLWEKGMWAQRPPLDLLLHQVQPGEWVLIRSWKEDSLTPKWEGPYLVLITTDSAI